ncbi:TPA: hypothetical protein HA246_04575 [Candidatus Woesearchaeota archaeon]|nr:hypothetical protein [Candidatus Woesearchaeota archaeon]
MEKVLLVVLINVQLNGLARRNLASVIEIVPTTLAALAFLKLVYYPLFFGNI